MSQTKTAAASQRLRQRAADNRAIRQETLREKFQGTEYLRQITNSYKELENASSSVKKAKATKKDPFVVAEVIAKADCLVRIEKVKIDTNFRRLAKVLPDLKSIEISDPHGNNPMGVFAEALIEASKQ